MVKVYENKHYTTHTAPSTRVLFKLIDNKVIAISLKCISVGEMILYNVDFVENT